MLGYVKIEIEGYYIEKFINMCTEQKIFIWNVRKKNNVKISLNIGIKDFKKLKNICKKTKCKAKIIKKKGLPFILYKYKKRKIFIILLIIVSIGVIISSNYVWNIDVRVKENKELEKIIEDLEKLGLKKGIKKDKIDANKIITEIRLKRNDISWMGIEIKGTNVIVEIVKSDEKPDVIDKEDYCNIIASKSGTITKIIAQTGTALVKEGDKVQKGDILIAGYMEGKHTGTRYVHSMR